MANEVSVESVAMSNDFATVRIPAEKRRSTFSVSMVIVGLIIAMSALYTGASLAGSLTLPQAFGAVVLGNIILCVYGGLLGIIGAREGLPVGFLVRHSFGRWGSNIISAIIAVTLSGWFAYQCGFFGQTINAMFPGGGFITRPVVAGIWGGILMMTTAYLGYKGLAALSSFAAPLIFLMALVGIFLVLAKVGGWSALLAMSNAKGGGISFSSSIVMVVGAFAVGGVIQPDCTRYCKNGTVSVVATVLGFVIAHTVVIMAGYIICMGTGIADLAQAVLSVMMVPSLFLLIFAQWTTNDNNLYSSSLGITNIFPKWKKKHVVLVLGPIATIAGAFGVANYFVTWLIIMGTGIPPVAGIMIADYFVFNKAKYEFGKGTRYGYLSIPAVIAWIIGAVIGFTVTRGIACINALVVSFAVYIILTLIFKSNPDKKYVGGFCLENEYGETERI
jgi:cytosine permease